jgi:hypothetical protein
MSDMPSCSILTRSAFLGYWRIFAHQPFSVGSEGLRGVGYGTRVDISEYGFYV